MWIIKYVKSSLPQSHSFVVKSFKSSESSKCQLLDIGEGGEQTAPLVRCARPTQQPSFNLDRSRQPKASKVAHRTPPRRHHFSARQYRSDHRRALCFIPDPFFRHPPPSWCPLRPGEIAVDPAPDAGVPQGCGYVPRSESGLDAAGPPSPA